MNYTDKELAQAAELYPALWVLQHGIKNEVGTPIDFEKRKFLWDIYNDLSPHQVLLKPPQIGATVMNTLKSLYVAKKLNRQIIYTLPTQGDVQDMVGGSFNRIIAQNPILMSWVKDHDTIEQKQVGESMIFYRGTFTQKQAMMIPSGLNIHDEVDASDPAIITQYETRLQAQEDGGWRWYFSHPSLAGHGVDVYWEQSDKKEWFITCNQCKYEHILEWPASIDVSRSVYVCTNCGVEIQDSIRVNGRWKATAQGEFSGYHVSQLMLYNKSAKDIIRAYNDPLKDKQYFYNYVLGLPYIGSDDRIEPNVVLRNCVDITNSQEGRTIIGADTSHGINYVLMNKEGVFFYDRAETITASKDPYDVIRGHLKRFPKSIAVFDQGGDLIGVRKLQAEYPGRVFLVFYRKDRKSDKIVEWGEGDEYGTVRVDRNRMMTLVIEQLRDTGRIRLNGTKEEWAEFAAQFDNIYREKITAKETREKDNRELYGAEYVWKRNGHDDYCFIAGTKITTSNGDIPIDEVKVGDMVLTRRGYKRVYHAGQTGTERVLTAYFSNGSSFTATAGHPLITTNGKTRLDSVEAHAILYSCQKQKLLYTKGLLIGDTQTQKGETIGSTINDTLNGNRHHFISIVKFGLIPMVLFLRGLSFITKTTIRSITKFQTWCVNRDLFIKDIMSKKDSLTQWSEQEILNIWQGYEVNLTRGSKPPRVNGIYKIMPSKLLCWLNPKFLHVLSVILKALHEVIRAASFVPPDVVIVGLHENIEKKPVINIAVEEEAEYFANGILVSNCHALLYAIVGLQRYGGEPVKIIGESALGTLPKGQIVQPQGVASFVSAADFRQDNIANI